MSKLQLVASHEFFTHLRRPSFILGTLFLPFFTIISLVVTQVLDNQKAQAWRTFASNRELSQTETILSQEHKKGRDTLSDDAKSQTDVGYVDFAGLIRRTDLMTTTPFVAFSNEEQARIALIHQQIVAYYVLSSDYLASGKITRFSRSIAFESDDMKDFATLIRLNLLRHRDPRFALRLDNPMNLLVVRLDEHGQPLKTRYMHGDIRSDSPIFLIPLSFALLLYLAIFSAAGLLLNSVVEEKENRIMEIVLTSISPWQLLGGKIFGLGALGLLQMIIWIVTAAMTYAFFAEHIGDSWNPLNHARLPLYVWGLSFPYFLLGYLVYGGLMAGIGATLSNTRESSILTGLLAIPILMPFFFLFPIIDDPNGMIATVLSIIPYTASITMMARLTLTDIAWSQIGLSLVLLCGAVVFSIWFGAKLFRTTMLMTGKKITVREIIRALRAESGSLGEI